MAEGFITRRGGGSPVTVLLTGKAGSSLTVPGLSGYENFVLITIPVGALTGMGDEALSSLSRVDGVITGGTYKASNDVSAASVSGDVITFKSGAFVSYASYQVTMW